MISYKHNFIFIHPAKTGGNSIEVALTPYADGVITSYPHFDNDNVCVRISGDDIKHARLDYFARLFDPKALKRFYFFATARNPWDRVVSGYFYYSQVYERVSLDHWFRIIETRDGRPEAQFPKQGTGKGLLLDPVLDFVTQPGVEAPFRFIQFERLQEDFDCVCRDLGLPQTALPHTLKTDHEHYSKYYNEKRREIVEKRYAKDIAYFGYRFEKR